MLLFSLSLPLPVCKRDQKGSEEQLYSPHDLSGNWKYSLQLNHGFGRWLLWVKTHCSSSALSPVWTYVNCILLWFGCLENLHLSVIPQDCEICSLFFFTCCPHKCSSDISSLLFVVTVPKSTAWQIYWVINLQDYYGNIIIWHYIWHYGTTAD